MAINKIAISGRDYVFSNIIVNGIYFYILRPSGSIELKSKHLKEELIKEWHNRGYLIRRSKAPVKLQTVMVTMCQTMEQIINKTNE